MITSDHSSAPLLRHRVELEPDHGALASAVMRVTALGLVEVHLNGEPAAADVLTPGWTSYEKRLRYVEWDVTALIASTTTLVLSVGNGWFRGRLGWQGLQGVYGPDRAAAAELVLSYADGHEQVVVTDGSWEAAGGPVLADDLYDGETIDARRLTPARAHTAPDDAFTPARVIDFDPSLLEPSIAPPITRHDEFAPAVIGHTADGGLLLDFGQNLVGWLRIRTRGPAGEGLVVHHAEVLENGDLAVRPLRSAKATDTFMFSGDDDEFEPSFTFHGFRYARVEGWPGSDQEAVGSIRAVVIGSELERTGTFTCSDPDLVKLHQNVVWGMRGNFVGIPTDCPQRDERMGYLGDLAAFAPAAAYLYDVEAFLRDWFRDVNVEQQIAGGQIPMMVPEILKFKPLEYELPEGFDYRPAPMAMWQDGAVWIPWTLWQAYGDTTLLEQQRESIATYLGIVEGALEPDGTLTAGYQLGDWLDPAAPPDDPRAARADREVLATACMFRTASLAAEISAALGDGVEAERRAALATHIRNGFIGTYVEPDGRIRSDAPSVYALAIEFGLLTGDLAQAAGDRLAELVAEAGYRIATGFIGTPFVLHALSSTGHADAAYRLLRQKECPSWLYQVEMGATTVWERWDALLPDGTVNPGEMTSFNHYAFGSVADWMHRVVAGISPLEPGYRRVLFAPQPGGELTSAAAELRTPYGIAAIAWSLDEDQRLHVQATVPEGADALLRLPSGEERQLAPGEHTFVTSRS